MKFLIVTAFFIFPFFSFSQNVKDRLAAAIQHLQMDQQFKHAAISLYVADSKTGKPVFENNAELGLAPASTQKIITSICAYDLLGKSFSYKTSIGYDGFIESGVLNGNLYIIGTGDPTLGSDRWKQTSVQNFKVQLLAALASNNIKSIKGDLIADAGKWETQGTPGGWVWEDIGNYYGAAVWGINWHENEYSLVLKPGMKEGDNVEIVKFVPPLEKVVLMNELKTGKSGTGDNTIIYLPENSLIGTIRGTVPEGKENFTVRGSIPNAPALFIKMVEDCLKNNNISISGKTSTNIQFLVNNQPMKYKPIVIGNIVSPVYDSINYWFLQKSINLFGEALVKTIAYEKTNVGSRDTGLAIIRNYWSARGIEKSALKIIDGSGLSPANRVTTQALTTAMQYARQQKWFPSFLNALPEMNGIKMKSGYINSVRSYTGYVKSKRGEEYTFSFIINNYDGSASTVREKMYKLLDLLK